MEAGSLSAVCGVVNDQRRQALECGALSEDFRFIHSSLSLFKENRGDPNEEMTGCHELLT